MAFVYRAQKFKKFRPNTALGPGQYLPITQTKLVKSNDGRAPFESSVKKFNTIYGDFPQRINGTPGPGKYYQDPVFEKSRKIRNLSSIKFSGQEENLLQEKYLSKTGNNFITKYDINKTKEVLGFEVKDKRFKNVSNLNPGPGNYELLKGDISNKNKKLRAKSAMEINIKNEKNKNKNKNRKGISAPSIPYNDNGFEIDDNNSLVKLEDPNEFMMFRGDNKESVGPGSYDLDNPRIWLKNGTAWSKLKGSKTTNYFGRKEQKENISKISTRPQTALEISQNMVSTHSVNSTSEKSNMSRANTTKMLKIAREQRKWNMVQMRKDFKEETQRRKNKKDRVPLIANDIYDKEIENFNSKQSPGPGYYLDIEKESDFFKRAMPYPEFKQFFLSNNERFPEEKINAILGPTTYFLQNIYYNSAFNTGEIEKRADINKIKEAPFSTREKRFNNINSPQGSLNTRQIKTPGPGSYDPYIFKTQKKIPNNKTNMFNIKQKRFGPSPSELKWQMMTPGPGDYINPYTATGTRNTLLINGLYTDIRKGKEILRQKAKTQKPLKPVEEEETPGAGAYDPDKVMTIAYKNRKKAKERKENEKLKIAFDSHMKNEKNWNELKSNLGPGIYYKELPVKAPFIRSPFQSEEERMKDINVGSGLDPGHYNVKSYFDWNKKTYNVSFL